MKKTIQLVLWFCGILLISAFLAPFLAKVLPFDFKFERILSRCVMIGVLGSMIWYIMRHRTGSFKDVLSYGLAWNKDARPSFIKGFISTFGVLALLMVFEVCLGARIINIRITGAFYYKVFTYFAAALIIAVIEETFFRGFIFTKLRTWSLGGAFIVTSAFYSLVHFLKAKDIVVSETPTIADSFRLIGGLVQPFLEPLTIAPGFIGLFIFGMILSYACWKTRSLYWSMGIHAGAVYFLKIDGFFLNTNDAASVLLYGDKNVYTGIAGWGALLMLWGLIALYVHKKYPQQSSS